MREILRELRRTPDESAFAPAKAQWQPPGVPDFQTDRSVAGRMMDSMAESLQGSRQVRRTECRITTAGIVCPVQHATLRLDAVKQTARAHGVRIQPLFLASIFEGLSVLLQDELQSGRWRKEIRIQTPVDLRQDHPEYSDDPRGQFLGCIANSISFRQSRSFTEILELLNRESHRLRDSAQASRCLCRMETMAHVWDWVPRSWNRLVSPALFSAAALSSNVNLGNFFAEEVRVGQIASCLRFTGTGILIPLMIGLTTVGEEIFLTMTSHEGAFTTSELQLLMDHLVNRMTEIPRLPAAGIRLPAPQESSSVASLRTAGV